MRSLRCIDSVAAGSRDGGIVAYPLTCPLFLGHRSGGTSIADGSFVNDLLVERVMPVGCNDG